MWTTNLKSTVPLESRRSCDCMVPETETGVTGLGFYLVTNNLINSCLINSHQDNHEYIFVFLFVYSFFSFQLRAFPLEVSLHV